MLEKGIGQGKERAVIVALRYSRNKELFDELLDELLQLVEHAGAEPVLTVIQNRRAPDPRYLIGKGKALEVAKAVAELDATCVVFLNRLSPTQHRNLEELIGAKVIDRIALILDIFAQRARTIEGKLQVEMAQLTYLLPRIVGYGRMMSRLGGGIGTRGPGEKKLEIDRRKILRRIKYLRRKLERVRHVREVQRRKRIRGDKFIISIIGYTNAGKSTLFNLLTGSSVYVDPKAFATLDPTVRQLVRGPRELRERTLVVDTVGFIRDLPRELETAFKATFEELEYSDAFIHVVDASSKYVEDHLRVTEALLERMGLISIPRLIVLNKADLLTRDRIEELKLKFPSAILISASKGEGIDILISELVKLTNSILANPESSR